jgi:predicted Fe-S protein YdhL (DUF1289 family)
MFCWHSRHTLGDPHSFPQPYHLTNHLTQHPHIILPLYLYDHSGITMSTTPFSCPWDSGQVGWMFVTLEKVHERFGWNLVTDERRLKIMRLLRREVAVYDAYLTEMPEPTEEPDDQDDDPSPRWAHMPVGERLRLCQEAGISADHAMSDLVPEALLAETAPA